MDPNPRCISACLRILRFVVAVDSTETPWVSRQSFCCRTQLEVATEKATQLAYQSFCYHFCPRSLSGKFCWLRMNLMVVETKQCPHLFGLCQDNAENKSDNCHNLLNSVLIKYLKFNLRFPVKLINVPFDLAVEVGVPTERTTRRERCHDNNKDTSNRKLLSSRQK